MRSLPLMPNALNMPNSRFFSLNVEAKELGLDTLYINRFSPLKAKEVFHLPENMIPVALLDVGYEVEKENSIAILHYQSKEKEELVEIL